MADIPLHNRDQRTKEDTVQWLYAHLARTTRELRTIRASYEAARSYPSTENHWGKSDHLSPDAANNPMVRATLRSRSRFEIIENNPYLNGTLISLCNDFAGSGVRLRITDPDVPVSMRQRIEKQWKRWQRKIKLRKILWQLRMDKAVSGESFAVEVYNPHIKNHAVRLDYRVVEADCVTDPWHGKNREDSPLVNRAISPNQADGIQLDKLGYPTAYHFLNHHPGGAGIWDTESDGTWVPASQVIHMYRPMRGWHRGIPELTPSIPLCAVARRYTMALVRCAEIQASLAAVLESDIPLYRQQIAPQVEYRKEYYPDGSLKSETPVASNADYDPFFDTFEIEMGSFNILPQGLKMKTWDRVPVGQQYDSFIGALMREIFRPILVPYNIGIGCSKDSNMASGILDAGMYKQGQTAERYAFEDDALEPMCETWFETGCLTPGYFVERGVMPISQRELPDHEFAWDKVSVEHTDPTKIAKAIATLRECDGYSDRYICEQLIGEDYEDHQQHLREEAKFRHELDIIRGQAKNRTDTSPMEDNTNDDMDDDDSEDEDE